MINQGSHGATGTKDTGNANVISGIHDGDIMASIKDPNMREIVAKESLQYKPNSKNEGPEVSEENKKALANLLEVTWLQKKEYKKYSREMHGVVSYTIFVTFCRLVILLFTSSVD